MHSNSAAPGARCSSWGRWSRSGRSLACGYYFLSDYPAGLGAVMLFASGGIFYLIFQDIAPQSRLSRHWAPPLAAVVGFSVALFGDMLVRIAF